MRNHAKAIIIEAYGKIPVGLVIWFEIRSILDGNKHLDALMRSQSPSSDIHFPVSKNGDCLPNWRHENLRFWRQSPETEIVSKTRKVPYC